MIASWHVQYMAPVMPFHFLSCHIKWAVGLPTGYYIRLSETRESRARRA